MTISERLGKRLKVIRFNAGVKQKDLSAELGVAAPLLSMYEKGHREPSLAFLSKFSARFQIPLSQILQPIEDSPRRNSHRELTMLIGEMQDLIQSFERKSLRAKRNESRRTTRPTKA